MMPRCCCAILLSVWSLWGLPTLCVGGMLEHLCDSHEQRCNECQPREHSHKESGCPHRGDCEHEPDCGSDPCAGTVARYEQLDDFVSFTASQPAVSVDQVQILTRRASRSQVANRPYTWDSRLLIHPSDLPLLI